MRTLLLTGFESTRAFPSNPSEEVVGRLDGSHHGHWRVKGSLLSASSVSALKGDVSSLLDTMRPEAILSLGVAPGDPHIRLEHTATNLTPFGFHDSPDSLSATALVKGGPPALNTSVDLELLLDRLLAADIPSRISHFAGIYSCNAAFYLFSLHSPHTPCLFVHLPYSTTHVSEMLRLNHPPEPGTDLTRLASMDMDTMQRAVATVIGAMD